MVFRAEKVGEFNGKAVFYLASTLDNQVEAFRAEGIPAPYIVLPEEVELARKGDEVEVELL